MTRQVVELDSLAAFDDRVAVQADLHGCFVQSLDLTGRTAVLDGLEPAGAVFLGCEFADGVELRLRSRGALIFPTLPDLPFNPYRGTLYGAGELYADQYHRRVGYPDSVDAAIFAWAKQWRSSPSISGSLAVALHDHAITDALDEAMAGVDPGAVIGVMGGHATGRDTEPYQNAARLGRDLTLAGRTVVTGGGPGAMEAANLGAYLAPYGDVLDEAIGLLASTPLPTGNVDDWAEPAQLVRRRWPEAAAGTSVGVPTWFYGHEPPNLFSTQVAKYFLNPLREDTLLHRCRGGIVFLPGAAGTVQEIFQAACENFYAADEALVAPMVLVDTAQWTGTLPVWPLLTALGSGRTMGSRLTLVDTVEEAIAILLR